MTRGSCLCRGVAWEIDGPLQSMTHCHCSMCRKAHGAAFGSFAGAPAQGFRWVRGEDRITRYQSSPGGPRAFCSTCGAVVPNPVPESPMVFLPAGGFDDDPVLRPQAHIFVASKAPWYEIPADGLERHDAYPPGIDVGEFPLPPGAPPASGPGVLRGSCLCGAVAYEAGQARGLVHCHCTRCQKGRSAAFASNVFAESGPFRYTRGADRVRAYKVPEAARFTVAFCTVCGGGVPRDPAGAQFLVVPGGSLDDDPGPLPAIHIFVGSKALWYEIADDLEQFEVYPPGCASSHDWVAKQP
jgi:hypothetical protein